MFCPKCGSLMYPGNNRFTCGNPSCRHEKDIAEKDVQAARVVSHAKDKKAADTLVLDEITETLPKTHVECPKCGHFEAFWVMRQTRAADEPTTRIYRCTRCSHTWREY